MDIRYIDYLYVEPMSTSNEEFIDKSCEEVQKDYFSRDLIDKYNCIYYYETKGISADTPKYDHVLILFRMSGKIIASAILDAVEHYSSSYKNDHPDLKDNNGAYLLNKDSILVFKPIDEEELRKYIDFSSFGQNRILKSRREINLEALNSRINDNGEYQRELLKK